MWRKVQGSIVHCNLPMLQRMIAAGFSAGFQGIQKLDPLFLCVKHNFAQGYKCLYDSGARSPTNFEEPGPFPGHRLNNIDSTYFQAIKDQGVDYPLANHTYLSVAYHNYEVLRMITELAPADAKKALSTKYRITEKPEYAGSVLPVLESWLWRAPEVKKHGLVYLEIMRQTPSALFVEFLLSHGCEVEEEDLKALAHKMSNKQNEELFGCIMGNKEDRSDLPKIKALIGQYTKKK
eukprot:Phypoly_transcript_05972.p1 GENE.Phypoly_transcript_05972~~Phypoly_transcript_05972.p1  ORF type:complete len:235 (+),score=30.59 Phypoly_transcript_05972:238-942(+)